MTMANKYLVDPSLDEVPKIRTFIAPLLRDDLEADTLFSIAVTEIATNAIEAHNRRGIHTPVTILLDVPMSTVTISDQAGGFDATNVAEMPSASALRGRGLPIASVLCPGMIIEATELGVDVTLPYPTSKHELDVEFPATHPFTIDVSATSSDLVVVMVGGDFDSVAVQRFDEAITPHLSESTTVVIDLSNNTLLVSAAFSAITKLQDRCARVVVRGPHPWQRKLAELTGVIELWESDEP